MNRMDYLSACILGIVEGLTEYLPVSSSGHLIIAENLLHIEGRMAEIFTVIIQPGAILAVLILYWKRFWGLIFPEGKKGFYGFRGIFLLGLTTFPACLCGLILHSLLKGKLFSPFAVLWALVIGALCMLLTERIKKPPVSMTLDSLTVPQALGVGLFQCLALWPGFSRSAATIMGGLLLGLSRKTAVSYSFIAAVPVMFAASVYEILKYPSFFNDENMAFFLAGFGSAFISSIIIVKLFIYLLSRIDLTPFAIYRLLLAPLFYWTICH